MPSEFAPSVDHRREKTHSTAPQLATAIHLAEPPPESIETGQLVATNAQHQVNPLAPSRLPARKLDPPTCKCSTCERTGGGEFAVRAFMRGDDAAAARLSPAVVAALSAQRAKAHRRQTVDPTGEKSHG
jgi:hypothetical protein